LRAWLQMVTGRMLWAGRQLGHSGSECICHNWKGYAVDKTKFEKQLFNWATVDLNINSE
jgi:hypothetical protein